MGKKKQVLNKANTERFLPPFLALTSTVVLKILSRSGIKRATAVHKRIILCCGCLEASWKHGFLPTPFLHEHGGNEHGLWNQKAPNLSPGSSYLLDVRLWANYLTSLNLSFLNL